jgi:predicted dehydrogenase
MDHGDESKHEKQISRRRFLAASVAGASTFSIVPRYVLGGSGYTVPSEKINLAFIGAGGQAIANLNALLNEPVNIVAFCDVDADRAKETYQRFPDIAKYRDFRIMLEKHDKDIDAVVIAVPDHIHAVAAMAAIKRGKHVYCEKPLTHSVFEARAVAEAAREYKVATQMGNQGMAFEGNRLINEWIADDCIGTVREVHAWSDRPVHDGQLFWDQGVERPTETPAVPDTLDWDLWLGPAPKRPYHPIYMPFKWRGWWDFGSGGLGDMGIHNLAPAFSALNLGAPSIVHASSTLVNSETLPLASIVHYDFPAVGNRPAVKLHWYDGGLRPPRPDELEDTHRMPLDDGLIFVGDKGKLFVTGWGGGSPRLIPEAKMKAYKRPPKTMPRSTGHHKEWIQACKGGKPARSNFDFAGPLTEAVLLGTIAVRTGKKLHWDSKNLQITNVPDANKYINPPYRKGWSLY